MERTPEAQTTKAERRTDDTQPERSVQPRHMGQKGQAPAREHTRAPHVSVPG